MKTTLILSLLILSIAVNAQIVNIPDPHFKNALLNHDNFGGEIIDTNGDGEIQVSEAEAIIDLIVGDPFLSGQIEDMTGIEAFINIKSLLCFRNKITSLNLSQNTALEYLSCGENRIQSLDLTNNINLITLDCFSNFLTELNVSQNIALQNIRCYENNLSNIDLTNNENLSVFIGNNNNFSNLDLTNNNQLIGLNCENNRLNHLNIQNNNNENFYYFNSKNNPDLTCIFVDDSEYSEGASSWYKDPESTYVETQEECDALGFDEKLLKNINIFPNPAQNVLNIELPDLYFEELYLAIKDVAGKTIAIHQLKTDFTLDVSQLPSGIYFLNIYNNQNKRLTKKLVKL